MDQSPSSLWFDYQSGYHQCAVCDGLAMRCIAVGARIGKGKDILDNYVYPLCGTCKADIEAPVPRGGLWGRLVDWFEVRGWA